MVYTIYSRHKKRRSSLKTYLDEKEKMRSYDCETKARKLVEQVKMGIIPSFMVKYSIQGDASIPVYARKEVLKRAMKLLEE